MEEQWRPVAGYEGIYEVSDLGRVRRIVGGSNVTYAGRILKDWRGTKGYRLVGLSRDGTTRTLKLYRLVALAFVGPCPAGHQVNHIDGDKTNNRAENLEWATPSENVKHAYRTGLASNAGVRHPQAKLTEDDVRYIRATDTSTLELARAFAVTPQAIARVRSHLTWAHI